VKGVVLSPERRVELAELPVPEPGQDEVLVRSHFCGICGTDLHAADLEVFRPGVVMGHEFAGEIVALGPGVAGWSVGQRVTINPNGHVCGRCRFCRQGRYNLCRVATLENAAGVAKDGGMAEYVALHTSYLYPLPDSVSTRRGACVEPLAVAVRAVRTSPLRVGDTAAVIGGGPVGQLIVQMLRRSGASRVLLVEPSPFRREMALGFGADEAITPQEAADRLAADDLPEVDHVMECSGHVLALQTGLDLVAPGGSVRLVGMAPAPVTFDPVQAITKEAQIMTGFIYVEEFPQAIELVASGGVDVDTLVTTLTALEDYADAFTALRAPETTMKVLIETGGSG
jgi:2-desacetyl-2-hydroxyethyl bacteriochlorophyllide A dehydrogenase